MKKTKISFVMAFSIIIFSVISIFVYKYAFTYYITNLATEALNLYVSYADEDIYEKFKKLRSARNYHY